MPRRGCFGPGGRLSLFAIGKSSGRTMIHNIARILGFAFLSVFWAAPVPAIAQTPTLVPLGYTGSGISTDLRRVIQRAGLWTRRGLDVRPVYFNSGTTLAQAMLGGHIVISDSDVPAQLNLKVVGLLDVSIIGVTVNRLEHFFVARAPIKSAEELK